MDTSATHTRSSSHSLSMQAKIVIVGDVSVGKTSILRRMNGTSLRVEPTVGAAYYPLSVRVGSDIIKLNAWDTAGQERFRSMNSLYYRGSAVVVLVYDVSNIHTFHGLNYWLENVSKTQSNEKCTLVIVGNKSDISQQLRQVEYNQGKEFADRHDAIFRETSAKTGAACKELLQDIASIGPTRFRAGLPTGFVVRGIDLQEDNLVLDSPKAGKNKKSSCC